MGDNFFRFIDFSFFVRELLGSVKILLLFLFVTRIMRLGFFSNFIYLDKSCCITILYHRSTDYLLSEVKIQSVVMNARFTAFDNIHNNNNNKKVHLLEPITTRSILKH